MGKLPFEKAARTVLVKKEAQTDDHFGIYPDKRSTEDLLEYGVINVDKPSGPTTHQVSDHIQKILHITKSGHGGTLDPVVTGLALVALGKCTKIVHALLHFGKEYVCLMHVHTDISGEKIKEILKSFVGKIRQMPPVKSSVKREWRIREVYYIDILEIDKQDILFTVGCEGGTYIRKLCHDIGRSLGTGAHMQELRRTKIGPFQENTKVTLQELQDAYVFWKEDGNDSLLRKCIQPMEAGVMHLPKMWLFDTTVDSITHGATLHVPGISKLESGMISGDLVALLTLKGELIALAIARMSSEELMKEERGVAATLESVFMPIGVYPGRVKIEKEEQK